jgi:hypothetical protein
VAAHHNNIIGLIAGLGVPSDGLEVTLSWPGESPLLGLLPALSADAEVGELTAEVCDLTSVAGALLLEVGP